MGLFDNAWSGLVAVTLASALFGSIGIFVHRVDELPFTVILAYRFLFSVLAFIGIALASARWRDAMRPHRHLSMHYLGLGASIAAMNLGYYYAILAVGMGLATILTATAPVFVTLVNWGIWRTKPGWRVTAGIALGLTGVALVVGTETWRTAPLGVAAGLTAGAAFASWMLVSRVCESRGATGASLAVGSAVVGSMIVAPVAFVFTPAVPDANGWITLAALGILVGTGAVLLLEIGLRSVDAAHAGVIAYVEPVVAVALGALILHESYTLFQMVGGALVIAGMITVSRGHQSAAGDDDASAERSRPESGHDEWA